MLPSRADSWYWDVYKTASLHFLINAVFYQVKEVGFAGAEHVKTMLVKCNYCSKLFSKLRHHFGKLYMVETNSEIWRCWNKLHVQGTLNDTLCGKNLPSCVQKGSSIQPALSASVKRSRPTSYIKSYMGWTIQYMLLCKDVAVDCHT